jgi:hypothetical protein
MDAAVDVFRERFDQRDTTDLETSGEKSEDVAVLHEVPVEEAAVKTMGAL